MASLLAVMAGKVVTVDKFCDTNDNNVDCLSPFDINKIICSIIFTTVQFEQASSRLMYQPTSTINLGALIISI